MSNLFVVTFKTEDGAQKMLTAMADWQKQKLIKIDDAAVVVRRNDGQIKIKQAADVVGKGAMGGAFWGGLIGLVFLNPVAGAAVGSGVGALVGQRKSKKLAKAGIDPYFIREIAETMGFGSSAVFAYTREGVVEKILPQLKQYHGRLIKSSLTWEDEEALKKAFGSEATQPKDPLDLFKYK